MDEFEKLQDWCQTFNLFRGKQEDDEEDNSGRISGKFKVSAMVVKLSIIIFNT